MMIPEAVQISLATADRVVERMRAGARVGREVHADEVHHLVQAYVFLLSVIEASLMEPSISNAGIDRSI